MRTACALLMFGVCFAALAAPQPVSIVSTDLNGDGQADLILGCAEGNGGSISVRLRAPETASSVPFAPALKARPIEESPDYLVTGDFDLDGHQDLLVAANRSAFLELYPGDGRGGFGEAKKFPLTGQLTAVVAGEVNRPDGIADVVVAVDDRRGAKLLVFENYRGAFARAPEAIELRESANDLALGLFDDDIFIDIAAGGGEELTFVHGRDRMTSLPGPDTVVAPIRVDRMPLDQSDERAVRAIHDGREKGALALRMRLGSQTVPDLVVASGDTGEVAIVRAALTATFVVDTTGDGVDVLPGDGLCADAGGQCSLRAAIEEANATAGADAITFNLGSGTPTIHPTSALPAIVETVTINGATGGATRVELNGAGISGNGLVVSGTGSAVAIKSLVINQFSAAAIRLETANNVVEDCYLGTDATGDATVAGNAYGVLITGESATTNTIGGTTTSRRNVISHNGVSGIRIESSASGNTIQGNYIGTNASGTAANANGNGIQVSIVASTVIGGAASAVGLPPGNLISGNSGIGISVVGSAQGAPATGTIVQGNLIGTDVTGTGSIPNVGSAITVGTANITTIGGSAASLRNVITESITFNNFGSSGSVVQGNFLGTDITGLSELPGGGVSITNGASSVSVGGNTATPGTPPGNVIRGGVTYASPPAGSTSAILRGNLIGLRSDGQAALPNATGVTAAGSQGGPFLVTIGGDTPGDGNVISGVSGTGVSLFNTYATMKGNRIGLNIDGTSVIGNAGDGIFIRSAGTFREARLTLGGTTAASRNVISGNAGHGVALLTNVTNSVIEGNYIGVLGNGTTPAGNGGHGVLVTGSPVPLSIGGTTGLTPGACTGACNVIAGNALDGIAVTDYQGGSTTIRGNSMFGNLGLGIDLDDNGVTPNDIDDTNLRQNFPIVTSATFDGGATTIQGTLNSTASTTFAIDVFGNTESDSPGFPEGRTYRGSTTCVTNSIGSCSWSLIAPGQSALHTATATGPSGRTSELTNSQDPNDLDGDGLVNGADNCPNNYNPQQQDQDGDGKGDPCDNCASIANTNQANADGDALGDLCDPCPIDALNDEDHDGLCANLDNCPTTWNHAQANRDSDRPGDRCDNCPSVSNQTQVDSDLDGAGDPCDCEPLDSGDRVPQEVAGVTAAKSGASGIKISWLNNGGPDRFSLTRGLVSQKAPNQYGRCLVEGIALTGPDLSFTDPEVPPPGDGFFYLVQGQSFPCGMGPLGFTSSDADRVNNDPNACHGIPFQDTHAFSETTVIGTVTGGSYVDTFSSNDVDELLREAIVGGVSRLDHQWTFTVAPGAVTELHVECYVPASPDGDFVRFAYSTDGVNFTYTTFLAFPAVDQDSDRTLSLPSGLSGNVIIRASDSAQTTGTALDTVHVDELWIRSIP